MRPERPAKRRRLVYRYVSPTSEAGQPMYALLRSLVLAHHTELLDAHIALAWHVKGWTADADGRVTLGKCKRVGELDREVAEVQAYDFIIILNRAFWTDLRVDDQQRRALLDHELTHASVKLDDHGEPLRDEQDRIVYRLRKHDLEEFSCIAERYGCWKRDLQAFAHALDQARHRASGWIGFSGLRDRLAAAGVDVPIDTVVQWSEAERREAGVWADLSLALQRHGPTALTVSCPAHVQAAIVGATVGDPVAAEPYDSRSEARDNEWQ